MRTLHVVFHTRTNSSSVCSDCQHLDLRHSPHAPPQMACGLFKTWLSTRYGQHVRLAECLEAEQRALRGTPPADDAKPAGSTGTPT